MYEQKSQRAEVEDALIKARAVIEESRRIRDEMRELSKKVRLSTNSGNVNRES